MAAPGAEHHRKLERMYHAAPTNRYYRPRLSVGEAVAEVTLAVREEFHHAAGAVHGSVYFKMLDDAAYFAVSSLIDDVCVLTASFQIYLTRPVSDGTLTAAGGVAHRSRRLIVAESRLVDSRGREVARGSGTFMRSEIPLSSASGYA